MSDDDIDPISAFAELIEDMDKMAATMTRGVGKMLKAGWDGVVLASPDEQRFYITLSPPRAPGLDEMTEREYPNIATIELCDLPITSVADFTDFMRATILDACNEVESRIASSVARAALTSQTTTTASPIGDGWQETKLGANKGRGFLTEGIRRRYSADPGSETRQRELTAAAKEQLDSARAEEEARRSIAEALGGD